MSGIRCIYREVPPPFPASDQHPDAVRHGPIEIVGHGSVFVDAIGGEPTPQEIEAMLAPAAPTVTEKLAAAGISLAELRQALGLA